MTRIGRDLANSFPLFYVWTFLRWTNVNGMANRLSIGISSSFPSIKPVSWKDWPHIRKYSMVKLAGMVL